MKRETNGELLWKSNFYLLQRGVLVYWLTLSVISVLTVIYQHKNLEADFLLSFLLGVKGAAYLIFYYKIMDCMVEILVKREKVGVKFKHVFTFSLAIRYALTLFILSLISIYLLPPALGIYLSVFIFFISPAMLITILLNQNLMAMLTPANWKVAIEYVGKKTYFAILYMPMIVAIIAGVAFGIVFLLVTGSPDVPQEKIEFSSLLLQSFISPYFVALQMIYCAFMMRTPNVSAEQLKKLEAKINEIQGDYFSKAQESFSAGNYQETIRILQPKIEINNQHLPSYLLLRQALEKVNHDQSKPLLEELEMMMILHASLNHEDFYHEMQPHLIDLAKNHMDKFMPELIYPLILAANQQEDYELVLLLTKDFRTHFASSTEVIIQAGFLSAQALDKTGQREQSIQLLHELITEFPNHKGIARLQRAYTILTQPKE